MDLSGSEKAGLGNRSGSSMVELSPTSGKHWGCDVHSELLQSKAKGGAFKSKGKLSGRWRGHDPGWGSTPPPQ